MKVCALLCVLHAEFLLTGHWFAFRLSSGSSRLVSGAAEGEGAQQESTHHPESDARPQRQATQL